MAVNSYILYWVGVCFDFYFGRGGQNTRRWRNKKSRKGRMKRKRSVGGGVLKVKWGENKSKVEERASKIKEMRRQKKGVCGES